MQLLGKLRRERKAMPQGPMRHARSAPAWHVSTQWDAFNLAEAISAESAEASEKGKEALMAAPLPGASVQDNGSLGPRSKLLKISGNAASVKDISTFADSGAKKCRVQLTLGCHRRLVPGALL